MFCRKERRSPCFTNSVMRQSGSWMVTQPTKPTTCGLFPLAIFFIVSISCRKSVLSLPVALAVMWGGGVYTCGKGWVGVRCFVGRKRRITETP